MDDATASELRCTGRALTGAAGALLAVGLAATAAHLATRLRRMRALTSGRELGHHDLVDQRDVRLHVEDLGGQVRGLGCHLDHAPFAAVRIRTMPPRGPGTAPLMSSRP